MKFLITLIGLILIIEGLPYVAFPKAMQNWLRKVSQLRPDLVRIMGLVAMASGFLLCYLTQRTNLFGL